MNSRNACQDESFPLVASSNIGKPSAGGKYGPSLQSSGASIFWGGGINVVLKVSCIHYQPSFLAGCRVPRFCEPCWCDSPKDKRFNPPIKIYAVSKRRNTALSPRTAHRAVAHTRSSTDVSEHRITLHGFRVVRFEVEIR